MNIKVAHNFSAVFANLQKNLEKIDRDRAATLREIAITALGEIQAISPIATGAFRANNQLGINSAPINRVDVSEGEAQSGAKASESMTAAKSALEAVRSVKKPLTIYITNNVPYAQRLESGWSRKAPRGIYAIAERRAQANIRKAYA